MTQSADSSFTLWSALMVGLMYIICSLAAMLLINLFLKTHTRMRIGAACGISGFDYSPTSWPIAPTITCR